MSEYPLFKKKQLRSCIDNIKPIYNEEEVEYVQIIFDKKVVRLNLLTKNYNIIASYEADPKSMGRAVDMAIKIKPQWNITMKLD